MNNEYDNEIFFREYAKMSRSKDGLCSAGEWHQLKPLFPPLQGKKVLDLGCGYGWHCKFAAEQGAVQVLGIDLSRKMIEEARKRNTEKQIEYNGFALNTVEEVQPPQEMMDIPGMKDELRRPMMLLVKAITRKTVQSKS